MVPASFLTFFTAAAQTAAALVGLLFVAISLAPENTIADEAPPERRAMARNAFTALANAFFVSIFALIPNGSIGVPLLIVGVASFLAIVPGLRFFFEPAGTPRRLLSGMLPTLFGVVTIGVEIWQGVILVLNPTNSDAFNVVAYDLTVVFVFGLLRAWQLLGGETGGVLGALKRHADGKNDDGRRVMDKVSRRSRDSN